MNELTLGDLTGTGGNAVIDVLIDKLIGKKPEINPFQWSIGHREVKRNNNTTKERQNEFSNC
jgi:hypothetical protein